MQVVARELEERGSKAGGLAREVLEAQAMMAEDPTLDAEVESRTSAGKTAEFAVSDAFASFRDTLAKMKDFEGATGTFGAQTPVGTIDGRIIGTGQIGPMTERIRTLYKTLVGA